MTLPQLLARSRPDVGGLPRPVWLLVGGRAVNQLGAFTLPFLTVALTHRFGASVSSAGVLMAVFGAATIVSRLGGGWLADRVGRRGAIVAGLTLTATAQLAVAAAPDLAVAAVAVTVLGLAFEIYEPPSQALIADLVPAPDRSAAYGLLSAALSVASVAAGLLAAGVGALDVRLLFALDAATCLACAALLRVGLPAGLLGVSTPSGDQAAEAMPTGRHGNPWRDRRLLALLGSGVVSASVYLQVSATLGLTLDERGIPATRVGLLFALSAATVVLGRPLMSRGRLAHMDVWRALAVGYLLIGAGLLANGFASTLPQFAAATVLWSLGNLVLLGRAHGLVAEIAPPHARARYFSVYGLCWGAAAVIGPFAGTQLLAHLGPAGLWASCAVACVGLAAAQPGMRRLLAG